MAWGSRQPAAASSTRQLVSAGRPWVWAALLRAAGSHLESVQHRTVLASPWAGFKLKHGALLFMVRAIYMDLYHLIFRWEPIFDKNIMKSYEIMVL